MDSVVHAVLGTRENQPPTEVIMMPSSSSQTVVFWAACFNKPSNYGYVNRSFCLAIFLRMTFFPLTTGHMTLAGQTDYPLRKKPWWWCTSEATDL